jgi:SAM-dependent methyltransferase
MLAAAEMRPTVLDLGCGATKEPHAFGVDNAELPDVDLVHDLLEFPYPFSDDSAKEIYLKHVLEHFPLRDLQRILGEVYRILAPGGVVHVRVPHVFSVAAWADPTHRMAFAFESARFFTVDSDKAYYKETDNRWELSKMEARVTFLNWKGYTLRRLDGLLGKMIGGCLNWLLQRRSWPGAADLFVRALPMFFVEIRWELRKPAEG